MSRTRTASVAAALCIALLCAFSAPSFADSKSDLEKQRSGVSSKLGAAERTYDESSKAYEKAAGALKVAQGNLATAEATLSSTRGQLAVAEAQDAQMQAELEKNEAALKTAIAKLDQGEKDLESSELAVQQFTVQSLQEGDPGLRAFGDLLRGESPNTFSERMSYNDSVSDAQAATMQALDASRVMLQLNRDTVQKLRDEVAAQREAAAANLVHKQELQAAAESQAAEITKLVQVRADAESDADAERKADQAKVQALESERANLESRIRELAAKELAESQSNSGGGGGGGSSSGGDGGATLSKPVNGPITSPYGMRVHPITGVYKLHDGTDFGVGCGTPIRAAASGTIIQQYYNAGYGNRIILNNGIMRGKSIVTTYNHLSRYALSTGAKVSRGQVIGYVGQTGYATGCHLHLMVLVNGVTSNPMNWL